MVMMLARTLPTPSAADTLEALFQALYGLPDPALIPGKLALGPAWTDLLGFLRGGRVPDAPLAPLLETLYRAAHAQGAASRYLAAMGGVRLPIPVADCAWRRNLGPLPQGGEAFGRALAKLRLESQGLYVRQRVALVDEHFEWAIAGLLPTGRLLRVAIRVRPTPSPMDALAEDLADDRLAAAGFEVLGLREWQLRYAGACALEVAAFCKELAPHLTFPCKVHDPDDDHPLHRHQATPTRLTPREASPNWGTRERLRQEDALVTKGVLLRRYRAQVLAGTQASADPGEAPSFG